MAIHLEIRTAADTAFGFRHPGPRCQVGRNPGAELTLSGRAAEGVSWDHAAIEMDGRSARVLDLGSTNGTYVNGWRVAGAVDLRPGDEIRLGRDGPCLRVRAVGKPPERAAAATPPAPTVEQPLLPRGRLRTLLRRHGRSLPVAAAAVVLLTLLRVLAHWGVDALLLDGLTAVAGLTLACAVLWSARRREPAAVPGGRADLPTPFQPARRSSHHRPVAC